MEGTPLLLQLFSSPKKRQTVTSSRVAEPSPPIGYDRWGLHMLIHANQAAYHLLCFWPASCYAGREEGLWGDGNKKAKTRIQNKPTLPYRLYKLAVVLGLRFKAV